jgi:hypothetical protein
MMDKVQKPINSLGTHLSDNFPIQNGIKQDVLSSLLLNFTLEYAIRKVLENQLGLIFKGTHHLLVYANDVHILGDNIPLKNHRNFH